VLVLLSLNFSCAKDLITGKNTYNLYSIASDHKLGTYVMKSQLKALKKGKKEYDSKKNAKQLKQVKEIMRNVAKVSHYPKFAYEVHVADVPVVNAWAAPGGKMMVYEGLWDPKKGLVKKGDEDELAAVISHEIAHATARHVTEAVSRNVTIMAVGQVAISVISTSSVEGANLFQDIFSQGFNIFIPSYSRKNELEADKIGLIYMSKAGYDPRAAVRVWKRASKKRGDRTSIYSSHPPSGIRAKYLEKHLPEALSYYDAAKKEGVKRGKKR
jgi:predicted Zn-dependent protease